MNGRIRHDSTNDAAIIYENVHGRARRQMGILISAGELAVKIEKKGFIKTRRRHFDEIFMILCALFAISGVLTILKLIS